MKLSNHTFLYKFINSNIFKLADYYVSKTHNIREISFSKRWNLIIDKMTEIRNWSTKNKSRYEELNSKIKYNKLKC
jgi:hypothetical protein